VSKDAREDFLEAEIWGRLALEKKGIHNFQERVPVRFIENQNLVFLDIDNALPFAQQEFLDPAWSANDDIGTRNMNLLMPSAGEPAEEMRSGQEGILEVDDRLNPKKARPPGWDVGKGTGLLRRIPELPVL
jgi:hypothetical protein